MTWQPIRKPLKRRQQVEWTKHPEGLEASGAEILAGRIRSYDWAYDGTASPCVIYKISDADGNWIGVVSDARAIQPASR